MQHGGRRQNSGRKKGSNNQSSKIALDLIKEKINNEELKAPVEILMEIAHLSYAAAKVTLENKRVFNKDMFQLASDAAAKAAPYLHAKLIESKTEVTNIKRPEQMTDDELKIFLGNSVNS